jgi:hypothetical protein
MMTIVILEATHLDEAQRGVVRASRFNLLTGLPVPASGRISRKGRDTAGDKTVPIACRNIFRSFPVSAVAARRAERTACPVRRAAGGPVLCDEARSDRRNICFVGVREGGAHALPEIGFGL